ncbi:MAG: ROK family protein [Candidatus Borkfalkiaceae bacterium]|nr:ROK family protein [Christensenellaceae bacterium]
MTENEKYYIGIDLGGTFVKCGIITRDGEMIIKNQISTNPELGAKDAARRISLEIDDMINKAGLLREKIAGVGMGVPGMIDGERGIVVYADNLKWQNEPIAKYLEEYSGFKVKAVNDANAAALGEATFGAAKDYSDSVLLTLGTGVGGGIIINKKIFAGNRDAGAELGHMIIKAGGRRCGCGLKGCLEAYASATALIKETKRQMLKHKDSKMWEVGIENVNGKTSFDYAEAGDETARKVVDDYLKMLTVGLINVANIFRPQAIIIGGGISKQKYLDRDLQKFLNKDIFAGKYGPEVKVLIAKLRNDAGTYGAAALWF